MDSDDDNGGDGSNVILIRKFLNDDETNLSFPFGINFKTGKEKLGGPNTGRKRGEWTGLGKDR